MLKKKHLFYAKKVLSTIVGIGTGKIVYAIIENNTSTEDMNAAQAASVKVAALGLGYMASEFAAAQTEKFFDEIVCITTAAAHQIREDIKNA